jgi:hypothetical protein
VGHPVKAKVIAGIALGLRYAYGLGLVHQDLTMSNIIFNFDHGIQIVDFKPIRLELLNRESEAKMEIVKVSRDGWTIEKGVQAFTSILSEIMAAIRLKAYESDCPSIMGFHVPQFISDQKPHRRILTFPCSISQCENFICKQTKACGERSKCKAAMAWLRCSAFSASAAIRPCASASLVFLKVREGENYESLTANLSKRKSSHSCLTALPVIPQTHSRKIKRFLSFQFARSRSSSSPQFISDSISQSSRMFIAESCRPNRYLDRSVTRLNESYFLHLNSLRSVRCGCLLNEADQFVLTNHSLSHQQRRNDATVLLVAQ